MNVIAIDHGYFQMKTPSTVFISGASESHVVLPSAKNTLHYLGHTYQIGSKRKSHDLDKTKTDEYYLLTLVAIAKEIEANELPRRLAVHLSVGLPLSHYQRGKDKFIQYLKRKDQPVYFVFEENEYEITIEKVSVNVQGFSAIVNEWINGDLAQDEPVCAVIDVGGWTSDVFLMIDDEPQADSMNSLTIGMIGLFSLINKNLKTQLGIELLDAQIERYLMGKKISLPDEQKKIIDVSCKSFSDDLLGKISECNIATNSTPLIFLGGGASILKPYLSRSIDPNLFRVIVDVHANAKGYEVIANEF